MTEWHEHFQWYFPGGLAGIISASVLCLAFIVLSYFFTLRQIPLYKRILLLLLRIGFMALLFFCLCRPAIVRSRQLKPPGKKKIAVVIDNSSSMNKKGFWGKSRFDEALSYWKAQEKEKGSEFKLYTFDETLEKVPDSGYSPNTGNKLKRTMLFINISNWLEKFSDEGVDGVVCLTDGIDTSGASIDKVLNELKTTAIPHVFVPITAKLPSEPYAEFEKFESDTTAMTGSMVPVSAVVNVSGIDPADKLQVVVSSEEKVINKQEIHRKSPAPITKALNFLLPVKTPGLHVYKAKIIAGGKTMAEAVWSIQGIRDEKIKILLYQGGGDWGTRFLKGVFGNDEHYQFDAKFAPHSFGRRRIRSKNIIKFPTPEKLAEYNVVIFLKMRQKQIKPEMEETLREFIKNGKSVLFIIANTLDAKEYAASPLEKMLPVEFESNLKSPEFDKKTKDFIEKMRQYRIQTKRSKNNKKDSALDVPPLTKFKLTDEGLESSIFKYRENDKNNELPEFQDFALIRKGKPGASVLAVHPSLSKGEKARILLAVQKFGKGRSAVLATDPMWRWRLSMPADNQSFGVFWKNIAGWLGAGQKSKPYWILSSAVVKPNKKTKIIFKIPGASKINFKDLNFSILDIKTKEKQKLLLSPTKDPDNYSASFLPKTARSYKLNAKEGKKIIAEAYFSSSSDISDQELMALTPDTDTLTQLASPYNCSIVNTDEKFDWSKWLSVSEEAPEKIRKEIPLWHKPWIFALLLVFFLAELIIRRTFKLV